MDDTQGSRRAKGASPTELALQMAGATTGAWLYTAYVHVNAVGDAAAAGLYDTVTSHMLLREQRGLVEVIVAKGRSVLEAKGLDAPDHIWLTAFVEAAFRLGNLIAALDALVDDRDPTHRVAFEAAKADAWKRVSELVGAKG